MQSGDRSWPLPAACGIHVILKSQKAWNPYHPRPLRLMLGTSGLGLVLKGPVTVQAKPGGPAPPKPGHTMVSACELHSEKCSVPHAPSATVQPNSISRPSRPTKRAPGHPRLKIGCCRRVPGRLADDTRPWENLELCQAAVLALGHPPGREAQRGEVYKESCQERAGSRGRVEKWFSCESRDNSCHHGGRGGRKTGSNPSVEPWQLSQNKQSET